jgi:hypothetical protein
MTTDLDHREPLAGDCETESTSGCLAGCCDITGKRSGVRHNGGCNCLQGLDPNKRREVKRELNRLRVALGVALETAERLGSAREDARQRAETAERERDEHRRELLRWRALDHVGLRFPSDETLNREKERQATLAGWGYLYTSG